MPRTTTRTKSKTVKKSTTPKKPKVVERKSTLTLRLGHDHTIKLEEIQQQLRVGAGTKAICRMIERWNDLNKELEETKQKLYKSQRTEREAKDLIREEVELAKQKMKLLGIGPDGKRLDPREQEEDEDLDDDLMDNDDDWDNDDDDDWN